MEAHDAAVPQPLIEWRVRVVEGELPKKADKEEVERLDKRLSSLQKLVIGFMATVAGSSVLVSLTLLATVGTHAIK